MKLYRVEEVAKELNISKQAVYKKLNKESIQKFIVVEDGIKHLTEDGLKKLKGIKIESKEPELMKDIDVEVEVATSSLNSVDNRLIEVLNDVIVTKEKDIDHLRNENDKLMELLQQQNQLLLNSQKLQEKSLSNTELLLLEKRELLAERKQEFELNKQTNSIFKRLKLVFRGK